MKLLLLSDFFESESLLFVDGEVVVEGDGVLKMMVILTHNRTNTKGGSFILTVVKSEMTRLQLKYVILIWHFEFWNPPDDSVNAVDIRFGLCEEI